MTWLGTWAKRRKITVDNTNIDSDLTHFPVPIVLGTSVGQTPQDVSDIFDELSSQDVDDDFTGTDGDPPDEDLWENSGDDDAVINTNKLRFSVSGGSTAHDECVVDSIFQMGGTGDFSIDFESTPITQPATDSSYFYFKIVNAADSSDFCYFSRKKTASTTEFRAGQVINGASAGSVTSSTAVSFSEWRVTRESGDIKFWYYDTSWHLYHTVSGTTYPEFTNAIYLKFQLFSYTGFPALVWDIDNFTVNSGTIAWPANINPARKKIAITKSDGTTELYGEIEHWDSENEKAVVWASKHDLVIGNAATTDLYLYYDADHADNINFIGDTGDENTVTNITGDSFTGTDGDSPSPNLWLTGHASSVEPDVGSTMTIQSNALLFDINSEESYPFISSVFTLSGDFDIQIDMNPSETPSTNKRFGVSIGQDRTDPISGAGDWAGVYWQDGSLVTHRTYNVNNTGATPSFPTKARFVRSGSTLTLYTWHGSWVSYTSDSSFGTEDMFIRMFARTAVSGTFDVAFDNFTITSGTVKYKPTQRVWDDNFKAVYHMAQDPSGGVDAILDSTVNENHGASSGSMTSSDLVAGLIGKAIDFDGVDDRINFGSDASLDDISDVTFEAGIYPDGWGESAYGRIFDKNQKKLYLYNPGGTEKYFRFDHGFSTTDGEWRTPVDSLALGDDYSIAVTYENDAVANDPALYVDGVAQTVTENQTPVGTASADASDTLFVGNDVTAAYTFDGKIRELKISDSIRAAAWLKVSAYSLVDDLLIFGSPETDADVDIPAAQMTMAASLVLKISPTIPTAQMTMAASQDDPGVLVTAIIPTAQMTMAATTGPPIVAVSVEVPTAQMTMAARVGVKETAQVPTAQMAMAASVDGILLQVTIPTAQMTMAASVGDAVTFSQALADVYYIFTLTGDADGLVDIEIPITSFQARLRDGDPTFLSVVIPDGDQAAAINARSNGTLKVDMAYKLGGVFVQRETIVQADLESVRVDEGISTSPITLSGHKTETFSSKALALSTSTYRNTIDGKIRHRLAEPNINLRPGDTVTIGSDTFVADLISYFMSVKSRTMEISEA